MLTLSWDLVRRWHEREPGENRRAIPHSLALAVYSCARLWGWDSVGQWVVVCFVGMLRPGEGAALVREDVVLPEDQLTLVKHDTAFIRIREPKRAWRGPRRELVRIDDAFVVDLLRAACDGKGAGERLFPYSSAQLRLRWDRICGRLGVAHTEAAEGFTPGGLRGGGATWLFMASENIALVSWRGRWDSSVLERYIQEAGVSTALVRLNAGTRERILALARVAPSFAR